MTREEAIKVVKRTKGALVYTEKEKEALETLIPELAESEDERVIKIIINCLQHDESLSHQDVDDCITYLEKQKDQNEKTLKPELKTPEWVFGGWDDEYMINTVISRYSLHAEVAKKQGNTHEYNLSKSMENWLRNVVKPLILEKQKEQKPLKVGENAYFDPNTDTWFIKEEQKPNFDTHWENGSMVCEQKEPHYTKRNELFDKCVENCDPEVMKEVSDEIDEMLKKEQKPVEPSDDELQRHQDELYSFKVFAAKQAKEHHISFVHDFEWNNFCEELLSYFNEKQKPVDYDHEMWKNCEVNFEGGKKEVIDHPEKYGLQKPAEWSEEDEEMRNLIVAIFEVNHPNGFFKANELGTTDMHGVHTEEIISWLKSLRPQYHGDVTMTEAYKMGKEAGEASSWKPSEEQMEALKSAVKLYKDTHFEKYHYKIESLYEQLKKL